MSKTTDNLSAAFAEMERRGLTYDYDGNRNRRVIARAPAGAAGDFEGVQGRIPGMPGNGRPMEIDPARMKQLEEAMRGMQPTEPAFARRLKVGLCTGNAPTPATDAAPRVRAANQLASGETKHSLISSISANASLVAKKTLLSTTLP